MDMYAYIFIPSTKKYEIVKGSTIENFYYETPGRQSKTFSSKPFKYIGINNTSACQILIVAATVEEIKEYMKKRITVPKLNNSDLEMSQSTQQNDSEIDKARKSRADVKKTIAKRVIRTNSKIIQVHLSKTSLTNASNASAQEGTLKKKQKMFDNSDEEVDDKEEKSNDDLTDTEETSTKDNGEEDNNDELEDRSSVLQSNANNVDDIFNEPNEHLNDIPEGNLRSAIGDNEQGQDNPPRLQVNNDKCAQLIQERKVLKQQITKLRSEKLAAERLSRMLQNKLEKTRETISKKNQEKTDLKLKPKGSPTPICCNSNVFVRADALEEAYAKTKPSMFFERMLYLTWGRRVLANRCIKKSKNTPDHVKVLTPRKKRAVRKHFINYLKYFKYHSVLFNIEMNKMNSYANRAITCSKRYAELLEEHPQLATDEEEEGNIEMVEL